MEEKLSGKKKKKLESLAIRYKSHDNLIIGNNYFINY